MTPSLGRYVKVFERTTDNPVWTSLPATHFKVFMACLIRANYADATWYDGREHIEVKRGSFISSIGKLADFCSLSPQQVRDALGHMKRLEIVKCSGTSKWTLITLLHYERYNGSMMNGEQALERVLDRSGNEPRTNGERAENEPRTTIEEESEEIEKRVKPSPAAIELETEIQSASVRIHGRHPKPRRDIGAPAVARHLHAIANKIPLPERVSSIRAIDKRHEGWCSSAGWLKEGGEWAKGLDNWLAPTKGRYLADPPAQLRLQPQRPGGLFACEKCQGTEVILPARADGISDDEWFAQAKPCECAARKGAA